MEETVAQGDPLASMIVPILLSLVYGFIAFLLAKDKGRNVVLWTVLGFLPLVNFLVLPYFIGATNLRLEAKIDRLLNSADK
jgi:hypothetical protein